MRMSSAMMRRVLASEGAQQCWALAKFGCFLHCIHEYVLEVSVARARAPARRARARELAAARSRSILRVARLRQVTMCVGPSMLPTFNTAGDVVILDRTSQWLRGEGGKQRTVRELCPPGSVVISRSPTNPQQTVCKRVIAVEGDAIWVPPTPWEELAAGADARRGRRVRIPPGQVWLEGDNPHNSTDSRQYGPVPVSLVKGRVFCKVWPLWELGAIRPRPSVSPSLAGR